ncbi:heat-inducible transcription repressor HrcA [Halolactibacillus alkaliphilus]|uniref:Heat-inducible transcription repressor HrcA n=1 Tax=Halolactibacillus alkaliphilus TaxID=442899 RepID=A0A511X3A1_9BACI|nr:heat-inducible transcriptional repressor HrcA [Halolactibacillus alkaliphilus]GEN57428.1 heat-inducible transcription repressor HrcA [Halolactibacillus alkaliphilus]GGN69198.1 heat-inducible transcription repressor HrcA [Halolactibacillus alkaliphilus]SFO73958.1 heat-inducible transcription repressor HrcA [Halolactibacillus alkaliphilus]
MLSNRQLLILQVIIDEFIQTAQPIGSRAISKKNQVTFSPATIRNEMADLEDMGFLEKTHSSSGRVPSEKGYRFYVDHLLMPIDLSQRDEETISGVFNQGMVEFEQIIQNSVNVLSELTNYTSIILGPEVYATTLKQIQIIHLSKTTAVAILVTNTGHVEHRSFTLPKEINSLDLEKLVNILNDRLVGVPIIQLPQRLQVELTSILDHYIKDVATAFNYLKGALLDQQPSNLYVGGITNMLLQPEFSDVAKIHSLYSVIEQEEIMANILRSQNQGIHISIGQENKITEMQDCSLITATYTLKGQQLGTIALLGPKRMEYSRVISLLDRLSKDMTDTFHNW